MVTQDGKHHQPWHSSFTPQLSLQWYCQSFIDREQDLYTREQLFEILDDTTTKTTTKTTITTKPDRCAFTARQYEPQDPDHCAFTARHHGPPAITARQYKQEHEHEPQDPDRCAFTARQ